jgi:prepilin-type processing-associated H-X9-DG protein
MYANQHDGYLMSDVLYGHSDIRSNTGAWNVVLRPYLGMEPDPLPNLSESHAKETRRAKGRDIYFCPTAGPEKRDKLPLGHPNRAWGWRRDYVTPPPATELYLGSYGANSWAFQMPPGIDQRGNLKRELMWQKVNVEHASQVPLLADCVWRQVRSEASDSPRVVAPTEYARRHGDMGAFTINRHQGAINVVFMDSSVRKVGLKEIYYLNWHKEFLSQRRGRFSNLRWPRWMQDLP